MIQACVESSLGYSGGRRLGRSGQIRGMQACGTGLAVRMKSKRGIRDSPGFAAG